MVRTARFRDRSEAGQALGALVADRFADRSPGEIVVLGLPRGGVPVAAEVAKSIDAPLDVFVVRKVGVPGQPELAMGAVASGGTRVLNEDVIRISGVTHEELERVTVAERELLAIRESSYRGDRPAAEVEGKTVIVVDDGLATGASMRAAVAALRTKRPRQLVVAVPVAPPGAGEELAAVADVVLCARTPEPFFAVGHWYDDFSEVTDDEVRAALDDPDLPRR
jgi:putative phosphoribosyl transferase